MTQPLAHPNLYPFPIPTAALAIEGKFVDGGRGELTFDPSLPPLTLDLPPVEFSFVGLLGRKLLSILGTDLSPSHAFADKRELHISLTRLFGEGEPARVTKAAHRLRQRLRAALAGFPFPGIADPALALIENTQLGYRLSISPTRLRLNVLDEHRLQPDATRPMHSVARTLPPHIQPRG